MLHSRFAYYDALYRKSAELEEQAQAAVLNVPLHLVHALGHLNGGLGGLIVAGGEGLGHHVDGVLRSGGHVDHFKVELLELRVKGLSHSLSTKPSCRIVRRAPQPKRPVI